MAPPERRPTARGGAVAATATGEQVETSALGWNGLDGGCGFRPGASCSHEALGQRALCFSCCAATLEPCHGHPYRCRGFSHHHGHPRPLLVAFGFWTTVIFSSGLLGGLVLWLLNPAPPSYAAIRVPFLATFALFVVHRVEERVMGFFRALSELTHVQTRTRSPGKSSFSSFRPSARR